MPGGVIENLSDKTKARIAGIASNVDFMALERAYQNYCIARDHKSQAGRPVRDKLSAIAEKSLMLRVELQTMSEEALDALWDAIGVPDNVAFTEFMIAGLTKLSGASREAHNAVEITEGNRRSNRQAFVRQVAYELSKSDVPVNATPNGALCQIVAVLLDGDCPSDVAALVRNALRDN